MQEKRGVKSYCCFWGGGGGGGKDSWKDSLSTQPENFFVWMDLGPALLKPAGSLALLQWDKPLKTPRQTQSKPNRETKACHKPELLTTPRAV